MPQQCAHEKPDTDEDYDDRPQKVPIYRYPRGYRKHESQTYEDDYDAEDECSDSSASSMITVIITFIPSVSPVMPFFHACLVEKGAAVDAHSGVIFVLSAAFSTVNQNNLFLRYLFLRGLLIRLLVTEVTSSSTLRYKEYFS
jgi:hypothetical protein